MANSSVSCKAASDMRNLPNSNMDNVVMFTSKLNQIHVFLR